MIPRFLAVSLWLLCSLPAQAFRCSQLGQHHQHAGYLDVTGFVTGAGREYALLATTTGIAVIDCTLPQAPVERAFFTMPPATACRVAVHGAFAYAVSDTSPGLRVIDLTDPDHPADIGSVGGQHFPGADNLVIDASLGRIYCATRLAGVVAFDAAAQPDSPLHVGRFLGGPAADMVQGLAVHDGVGFLAMPGRGQLRLYDLGVWPPALLGSVGTPAGCPGGAAAGPGLCASIDACPGGVLQLFGSSNPLAPDPAGRFTPNAAAMPASVALLGDYCHLAWRSEGYRCLDVHDPANPVEVAWFDTFPGVAGGRSGAVGCFPALPSGNVFVVDSATGLHILQPQLSHLQLSHTPLGAQASEAGPYLVRARVEAQAQLSVALTWRVGNGLPVSLPMTSTRPGDHHCAIPGQLAPAVIRYHIVAADGVAQRRLPATGDFEFQVGSVVSVFADGFEQASGWTHGALAGADEWQLGPARGAYGVSGGLGWADPPAAFAGANVAGIDLGGPGHDGAYASSCSSWLQSPPVATGGARRLHLRYRRWLTLAAGDSARVLVNGRVVSSTSAAVDDRSWLLCDHDLSAIADTASSLTIRFELISDATTVAGGFTLDDVEVYRLSDQLPPQHYGVGTPGTGGHVPGLVLRGDWHVGTTAELTASKLLGGSVCVLLLGRLPGSTPVFGISALVDLGTSSALLGLTGGIAGQAAAGGASFLLPIPNDPLLDNAHVNAQVLGLDSGSVGGLMSCSDGLHFRLCRY